MRSSCTQFSSEMVKKENGKKKRNEKERSRNDPSVVAVMVIIAIVVPTPDLSPSVARQQHPRCPLRGKPSASICLPPNGQATVEGDKGTPPPSGKGQAGKSAAKAGQGYLHD